MRDIVNSIITIIKADATLKASFGARVYGKYLTMTTKRPCITIIPIWYASTQRGTAKRVALLLQADIWGGTETQVEDGAKRFIDVMEGAGLDAQNHRVLDTRISRSHIEEEADNRISFDVDILAFRK